ncbi:diaminobutyrate acetyltransferase [Actinopolyspora halophila]|uniref:diaminobutyrate acetyltransferase n=1 Tax=Actinopolyspora halophila TaxID=1850 RepID=UPI0003605AD1|nr:diaminobutyrate acetyltransferase [Actinopolyspora halophila]
MTGEKPSHGSDELDGTSGAAGRVEIETPAVSDGQEMYRITRDSGVLDVNSSYVYLLWCRDFAATSLVARSDGRVAGFVTGYVRPDAPDTVVVWQIGVDAAQRGRRIAARLLERLLNEVLPRGVRYLETTITADNSASINLFSALARDRGARLTTDELFTARMFPDAHEGEDLYRIGPLDAVGAPVQHPQFSFAASAPVSR